MNKYKLLKEPAAGTFVIVDAGDQTPDNPFTYHIFATKVGTRDNIGDYFIGTLVGDPFQDERFRDRLQRVMSRMDAKNMCFHRSVTRGLPKKISRMADEDRYKRKLGMVEREYEKRKQALVTSNLFADALVKELEADYQKTLGVLKIRYNQ